MILYYLNIKRYIDRIISFLWIFIWPVSRFERNVHRRWHVYKTREEVLISRIYMSLQNYTSNILTEILEHGRWALFRRILSWKNYDYASVLPRARRILTWTLQRTWGHVCFIQPGLQYIRVRFSMHNVYKPAHP